jgi:predicted DNA-binding transcriptional regulator YafY
VPFLPTVADAVWRGRALQVRYRRWKAPTDVDRRLEPYGLVLRAGRWYLVAGPRPATYRVDQILELAELADEFTIPPSFSLVGYWQTYKSEFLDRIYGGTATVCLTEAGIAGLSGPAAEAVARTGTPEPDGRTRAEVPMESLDTARREFLALGPGIEVLAPPELRADLAATTRAAAALY